jgi:hypothetical protein
MKKTIILLALIFVTLAVACQPKDKVFTQPIRLQGGVYLGTETDLHLTWPTGGSTAWSAITGKPTTLTGYGITDAALATHNHNALYRPITYVPTWAEITGKPTTFAPSAHNHDALYRPISWVPTWTDISGKPIFHAVATSGSYLDLKDKPEQLELSEALPTLLGIRLPVLTQTQINALVPVKGLLLWNDTDGVLQIYTGTVWKIVISSN